MAISEMTQIIDEITKGLYENLVKAVKLFHSEGVVLLAGTDLGNPFLAPGSSLHMELERLVDAGLTPLEAIQTATINPANVFNMGEELGQVAPNFLAGLVMLKKDPLKDIKNIGSVEGVVVNGRWFDKQTLSKMVEEGLNINNKL